MKLKYQCDYDGICTTKNGPYSLELTDAEIAEYHDIASRYEAWETRLRENADRQDKEQYEIDRLRPPTHISQIRRISFGVIGSVSACLPQVSETIVTTGGPALFHSGEFKTPEMTSPQNYTRQDVEEFNSQTATTAFFDFMQAKYGGNS